MGGVILSLSVSMLTSCQEYLSFITGYEKYAVKICYEEETVSYDHFYSSNKSTSQDLQNLLGMPIVTRQRIEIGINKDGTNEWIITYLQPQNNFNAPINCPSDNSKQSKVIKMHHNVIEIFDTHGNLMQKQEINLPSMRDLVEAVKRNGNKFDRTIIADYLNGNNKFKNYGENVREVFNDIWEYDKTITAQDSIDNEFIGMRMIMYYDQNIQAPLSFYVINQDNTLNTRILYKYNSNPTELMPEKMQTESYYIDENGNITVSICIKTQENFQTEINL